MNNSGETSVSLPANKFSTCFRVWPPTSDLGVAVKLTWHARTFTVYYAAGAVSRVRRSSGGLWSQSLTLFPPFRCCGGNHTCPITKFTMITRPSSKGNLLTDISETESFRAYKMPFNYRSCIFLWQKNVPRKSVKRCWYFFFFRSLATKSKQIKKKKTAETGRDGKWSIIRHTGGLCEQHVWLYYLQFFIHCTSPA